MHRAKVALRCYLQNTLISVYRRISNKAQVLEYLKKKPEFEEYVASIPPKYFNRRRKKAAEAVYLIDSDIAKDMSQYIVPAINEGVQLVADSTPGLALIAKELLEKSEKNIRLYEQCPEFMAVSIALHKLHPNRVQVFNQSIFTLARLSAKDKYDREDRVGALLTGVPKKDWNAGPSITIIGYMPDRSFLRHYMKMLAMQTEIAAIGRMQFFGLMQPSDYIILTAGPQYDLHTYQWSSVMFQLFFKFELLEVYPRQAFLPWESVGKLTPRMHYASKIDLDKLYFVKIVARRKLPIRVEDILSFYFFLRQCFGRGRNRVIPTLEKWIPGCGMRLILPSKKHPHYYKNLSIFSMFGQLTPQEILSVYLEMAEHPEFDISSFSAMIQSEVMKIETRETDASLLLEDTLDLELEDEFE